MDIKLGIELYNQGNFSEAEKIFLKVLLKIAKSVRLI